MSLFSSIEARLHHQKRVLVAVAGGPGSGKSTLVAQLVQQWNTRSESGSAVAVPMDGFHYPLAYLDSLENAEEARARRGAHWTFDASKFCALVHQLRERTDAPVYAPSFDHSVGDPVEKDIEVLPCHTVVFLEGNYLLLDLPPWSEAARMYDIRVFLPIDVATARERLVRRHMLAGLAKTREEAEKRADSNDLPNLLFVQQHLLHPDLVWDSTTSSTSEGSPY
ncbi:nicotinamide riboside kinase [Schizosaccharomyces japonicus yFS275]|uniref:Nicotinamide riboside kinase n=1 Tax=Schizosaccharomyces japonicus (strain yFS275 / FY16936) TaxID=402676 RepID=B6JVW7_SCHJY|nr:nicotinamide riboside kinase [Schizosaccharomyces japonicus yFS275]EEB05518.1 nicotinamide riboside kinase [Schizosaccharomyces japonicus yFS275]